MAHQGSISRFRALSEHFSACLNQPLLPLFVKNRMKRIIVTCLYKTRFFLPPFPSFTLFSDYSPLAAAREPKITNQNNIPPGPVPWSVIRDAKPTLHILFGQPSPKNHIICGDVLNDGLNANGRSSFSDVVFFFNPMKWIGQKEPASFLTSTATDFSNSMTL